MLTAIRGVSKMKAKDISEKFGSAAALVRHLEAKKKMEIKGVGKVLECAIAQALLSDS
jgi:ERCC4-type nuclease